MQTDATLKETTEQETVVSRSIPFVAAAAVIAVLWISIVFLRNGTEQLTDAGLGPIPSKLIIALVAMLVGVGGVWALFIATNAIVDQLGHRFQERVRPFVFVLPAVALLTMYLVYPTINTIVTSITDDGGFVENYKFVFTDEDMLIAFRNNILWLVIGTSGSVVIGLLFATLVDRVKREAFAKTFIFLPLAISMVGASVVWRFVYEWRPPGRPQIGIINAIASGLGREPVAFLQEAPINTIALIVIMIWLQTGFAMVVLSAALKGVPNELVEASRIDGANEFQAFFRVVIPSIKGSIITVATTVFIAILKVFDIVFVMTGGRFDTEVIANRMFNEMFRFRNFGRASALAVVLLAVVLPIMILNVRNLRQQGIDQ